jgi:hypothetical protein
MRHAKGCLLARVHAGPCVSQRAHVAPYSESATQVLAECDHFIRWDSPDVVDRLVRETDAAPMGFLRPEVVT